MIYELNILIWFGLTLILIVSVVMLRQQANRRHSDYYNKTNKHTNAENSRSDYFGTHSTIVGINTRTVLRKSHQEQSQYNQTLTESEILHTEESDLLQSIYESAPECMVIHKSDGVIELINNTGLHLLEIEVSTNAVGQQIYDLISQEFRDAYREMVNQVFLGNQASLEYEMFTFKGTRRWMQTKAIPMRNSRNEVIKLIAITEYG